MSKKLKISILLLFIFQLIIASGFELAHDEAYYWLYSHNLDWGYFDHPPMVAIVIKLFSFFPVTELSLRLGFILLQFFSLFLLMATIPSSFYARTTLLFFAFPLASYVGLFALPDMPLLFMTAVYLYFLKIYLEQPSKKISVFLGVSIAILLQSKYHGILLVFFTIVAVPKLMLRKDFYLTTVIALLCCLPHFIWEYQKDFITLRYHFLERPRSSFSIGRSLEYLGIQVLLAGVFTGPLVWWSLISRKTVDSFSRSVKFISLGTILFFLVTTFSKKFEANWTVFLAIPIIYLVVDARVWEKKWANGLLYTSFLLVMLTRLVFLMPYNVNGPKRLNEFRGWRNWSGLINSKCSHPILANTYQMASKLSFYLQRPIHAENYHSRNNQFDLWPKDKSYYLGDIVCYLTDKQEFKGEKVVTPDGKKLILVPAIDSKIFSK